MLNSGSIEEVTLSKIDALPVGARAVVEILRSFRVLRMVLASFSQSREDTVWVGCSIYFSSRRRPLIYLLTRGKFIARHDPRCSANATEVHLET